MGPMAIGVGNIGWRHREAVSPKFLMHSRGGATRWLQSLLSIIALLIHFVATCEQN